MVIKSMEPDTLAVVDSTLVPELVQELESEPDLDLEPVPMQEPEPIKEFRPKTIRDIDNKVDQGMEPTKINRQL